MALLQLTSAAAQTHPGRDVASLYQAIQTPVLSAFLHNSLQALMRLTATDSVYWFVQNQQQTTVSAGSDNGNTAHLSAQQIAVLQSQPPTTKLTPLEHPLFSPFRQPGYFATRCVNSGFIHHFFTAAPSTDPISAALPDHSDWLVLLLSHLVNACYLNRINAARLCCNSLHYDYALYDPTGRAITQAPCFDDRFNTDGLLSTGSLFTTEHLTDLADGIDKTGIRFVEHKHLLCRMAPVARLSDTVLSTADTVSEAPESKASESKAPEYEAPEHMAAENETLLDSFLAIEVLPLPAPFRQLTPREKQVCFYLGKALTNSAIARAMASSEKTIEHQLTSIYRKLGLRSRAMLIHAVQAAR
ncbi:MAG: helix-turn-helix transcriptional regulator [Marinobacterium sp.]|nr:helix-turn-helix transcriptional regulator [Marinobacterium sp.]